MKINIDRVYEHFDELKAINTTYGQGYTRRSLSKEEDKALNWFKEKLKKYGLYNKTDSIGNTFGKYESNKSNSSPILIGSHLDTVQNGGLYDGALGVLLGLEVLIKLKEENVNIKTPIEVVAFRAEEANILGGTFGSRAFMGQINADEEFNSKAKEVGYPIKNILDSKNNKQYKKYLEVHIEQGGVLEKEDMDIGIVTSIAGLNRYECMVYGESNHAGTTPMSIRADAMQRAIPIINQIYKEIEKLPENTVLTIGKLDIYPNQANVIPSEVKFNIEIRSDKTSKMKNLEVKFNQIFNNIQYANITKTVEKNPNKMNPFIQKQFEETAKKLGYNYLFLMSGANHDANSLAKTIDTGMLFVPSYKGISHHPEEFSSKKDIEKAGNTLLSAILTEITFENNI